MRFNNWASKSACVLLSLAGVVVAAALEEVEGPLVLGPDVEVSVATAFAAGGLPRYLDKHTVDLWPAFPQWWHTSLVTRPVLVIFLS